MIINKYKFNYDENNYIVGFYSVLEGDYDFEGQMANYPNATRGWTKFVNGQFVEDETKKTEILTEETKQARIEELKLMLSSQDSPYGDWKNLKQLDTGEYTEEEMAEYRAKRQEIREEINELEN